MFYDLNIPYSPTEAHNLPSTLAFAAELGYNIIALNHQISGKLPGEITCQIPSSITSPSKSLQILRRCTLTLTDAHPNSRLLQLAKEYDILALRPIDERTLQLACSSLDCDIISLDLTQRMGFFFKYKMLSEAIKAGKRIEICYSQGLVDGQARRNVISNATQLIRATRGRGMVICSETRVGAAGLRGPWDVVNLAAVWGLGQERGVDAVGAEQRGVVVRAKLKRTGYRGVVDVVYGGEKVEREKEEGKADKGKGGKQKGGKPAQEQQQHQQQGQKRKAEADAVAGGEQPLSNRQRKKQAHEARMAAAAKAAEELTPAENGG